MAAHRSQSQSPALPLAWLVAVSALAGGCTTYDGNRGLVPFFEEFDEPAGAPFPASSLDPTSAPISAAAAAAARVHEVNPDPIYESAGREVVLRPLFSYFSAPDRSRLRVLWPVVDYLREPARRQGWILPFWARHVEEGGIEGGRDIWMLFPLLYGGKVPEGRYFAVFPLAGKVRGLLAQDEIDFYVWPAYWRSRRGDLYSLHLGFPFYNRVWGGGRSGWRIWPFYGRFQAWEADGRERYDRMFILWPFYFKQRNELNTRHPSRLVFFFPFFGESENDRTLTRTYLWPLFHTTLDKRTGKKIYFGFLFPYRFAENQFDLWPFFGVKTEVEETPVAQAGIRRRYRHFILWPIERYDRTEDEQRLTVRFWLIPFHWSFRELRKLDGAESREWVLWPLYRATHLEDRTDIYIPSPLWWRQEEPLEKLYARLWRIFLFHEDARQRGWEVLFGLLSYRNVKAEARTTFRVLGGLFERRVDADGSSYRFFYLPWRGNG